MLAKLYDIMRIATPYPVRCWFKNRSWFTPVTKAVFGTDVYSESYYRDTERLEATSVEHMAAWIVANLRPRTVVDVGCGPGHLMVALHTRDVAVFGVDVAAAAIRRCREHGVPVERVDLTAPDAAIPGGPYDLAVSCEVAEHLDTQYAERFIDHLVRLSRTVYMTAAEPDPNMGPGLHHVNEQPNAYWVKLMAARGYRLDEAATADARAYFGSRDVISYLQKPLIFRG